MPTCNAIQLRRSRDREPASSLIEQSFLSSQVFHQRMTWRNRAEGTAKDSDEVSSLGLYSHIATHSIYCVCTLAGFPDSIAIAAELASDVA